MQHSKSLALKLSAAVLAAGIVVTGAGAAQAAPALSAKTNQQQVEAAKSTLTETANLGLKLAAADNPSEALKALAGSSAKNPQLEAGLKLLPKDATLNAGPGDDSYAPSSATLVRAISQRLLAVANGATAETCPESDATKWLLDSLGLVPPKNATKDELVKWAEMAGKIQAVMILAGNAAAYEGVWNGPDLKALTRFGEEQDKTKLITKSFKSVKRFWDTDFGTITDSAMKDDIFTKRGGNSDLRLGAYIVAAAADGKEGEKDPRLVNTFSEKSKKAIRAVGGLIQDTIDEVPALDGGEHPYFTFNAFAFSPSQGAQEMANLPKRFVFGDGLLTYLRIAKYGDSGVESIIGHELGHHIQYVDGFTEGADTEWENGRNDELEADYYGNYYAAHQKGANYTKAEKALAIKLFADLGDCGIGEKGHHGTPAQRAAATSAAFALADTQKKNGHVFAAESVRLKFYKALPGIIAAK